MALDFRIGTKIIKSLRTDLAPATNVSPYPYIGVVKNNLDPTRSGRVQVFIPELGGNPEDKTNWRTCSYASPFMGYTSTELTAADTPDTKNSFADVTHTYGMWMVPPDIGVEVIVMFIAGDPMRGYWLACVNSNLSRHMLPGLAGSRNIDASNANTQVKGSYVAGQQAPVVEFNENISANKTNPNFYNAPKPIHEFQYSILKAQGLDQDIIRGSISSSSQRETPSQVFGISTPGRPWPNDPADDPNYVKNAEAGLLDESYYRVKSRKGGHTFVMDDGAVLGQDQLMRLRTAGGHQILMHDTEETVYISHASGDSWIELTKDGRLNIYNKSGFSLRSEGDVNLHSDKNINFNAGGNISLHAQRIGNVSSTYSLADTVFDSTTGTWSAVDNQLNSIASIAPTHEPFDRNTAAKTTALSSSIFVDTDQLNQSISDLQNNAFITSATITDLNVLGNLGIGTTSTPAKLTIAVGNVLTSANTISGTGLWQVGADAANNGILLDSFGLPNQLNGRRAQGTKASPTALTSGINLLSLNGYGYGNTGYSSGGRVQITLQSAEAWTDTAQGTQITFATTPTGTTTQTTRMRISSTGNVGIGTTSPGQKLTVNEGEIGVYRTSGYPSIALSSVQASGYAPPIYQLNRTGASGTATPDNSLIGQIRFDGLDTASAYTNFATIEASIGTNASGGAPSYLAFNTAASGASATERVRIISTGNVGIGTTSPTSLLQIYNATSSQLTVSGDSTTAIVAARYSTDATQPSLALRKGRGTNASPAAVASSDSIGVLSFQGFGGTNNRVLTTIQSYVETYTSDSDISSYLTFSTSPSGSASATERMRVTSTGNVGIGTTNPGNYRLELVQNLSGNNIEMMGMATKNTAGSFQRFRINANDLDTTPVYTISTDGPNIKLAPDNTEGIRVIRGTGNVGIGVSSPTVKLDINGPFKTLGYTVATLPLGVPAGTRAYVTDATAPTFLGTLTGLGTVVCPVFFNGTAWVAG